MNEDDCGNAGQVKAEEAVEEKCEPQVHFCNLLQYLKDIDPTQWKERITRMRHCVNPIAESPLTLATLHRLAQSLEERISRCCVLTRVLNRR